MKSVYALTLTEVMIALLVFSALMVGVVTATTKSMEYAILSESRDEMAIAAIKIFAEVEEDLARSAWYFPAVPGATAMDPASFTSSADFRLDGTAMLDDLTEDRSMRYYPMVQMQSFTQVDDSLPNDEKPPSGYHDWALAQSFPWTHRSEDMVLTTIFTERELAPEYKRYDAFTGDAPSSTGLGDYEKYYSKNVVDLIEAYDALDTSDPLRSDTLDDIHDAHASAWQRFIRSPYGRSTDLIFLRTQRGAWNEDPSISESERLYFPGETGDGIWDAEVKSVSSDVDVHDWLSITVDERSAVSSVYDDHVDAGVLRLSDWDAPTLVDNLDGTYDRLVDRTSETSDPRLQYLKQNAVSGAWMSVDAGEITIAPRWETMVKIPNVDSVTGEFDPGELRDFMYSVIPCPENINGAGRLVRAYSVLDATDSIPYGRRKGEYISRSGDVKMVIDRVFSDDVARVVFETYRTQSTEELGLNEVRMHIFMVAAMTNREGVQNMQRHTRTFYLGGQDDPVANEDKRNAFYGDGVSGSDEAKVGVPLRY